MQANPFRFTRFQRLKKPDDFQRVYRSRQWGGSKHFSFNVSANSRQQGVLGVTVSKKVSKRAVDRNRIKRQIKEFYRLRQAEIAGADIVITAKPSCLVASDEDRLASLAELWVKLLKWQRWHTKQLTKEKRAQE